MATSYAAIERALLKQAKKDGDAYAAERRKKAESALRAYTADTEAAYAAKKAAWFAQARGEAADAVDARRLTISCSAALISADRFSVCFCFIC